MSTPLSENVQIGPKVSIFCVATIFSSTALTLLGMEFTRASHVATGVLFHSSMTISGSWWMLETLRSSTFHLRMPHRCSIGFRSGGLAWPVHHLYPQRLGGVFGVVIMLEYSLRPRLRREGIMLCFSMSQYILAFMVPSMNCSSPVSAALMQPQTMTLPHHAWL